MPLLFSEIRSSKQYLYAGTMLFPAPLLSPVQIHDEAIEKRIPVGIRFSMELPAGLEPATGSCW
jgi:hypothetical protein